MPRLTAVLLTALALAACGSNDDLSAFIDAPSSQHDARPIDSQPLDAFQFLDAPADPTGIATAINTPDGPANVAINGVTVTYLKPLVAAPDDPAGFTIQANQQGPGLTVSVDPTTTTPVLAVGDVVSFTITTMGTAGGERRATAIASVTRSATGTDVSALARDVSAATDLVSNLNAYDSTLVSVTGTIGKAFAGAGTGFQSAQIDTAGLPNQSALTFRTAATLVDQLDMVQTCQVTATHIPFGIFVSGSTSTVELNTYTTADFTMSGCPAPAIASIAATSATAIKITFTRRIDPTTLDGMGGQFTFDNNLAVTAATLDTRSITLTTSAQTPGTTYTLTFAGGPLKDLQGSTFTPPMTAATVPGFAVPAGVRINELAAQITGGCDLIELRVTSDGSLGNFSILERTGNEAASGELNFTFPPVFNVTKNALVILHMNGPSTTCNPGGATQEVNTVTDQPKTTFGKNFDTAFDFYTTDTGLTATDNVITVLDPGGNIVDAVLTTSGAGAQDTLLQANKVAAASQWTPGPTANGVFATADYVATAVPGLTNTDGTTKSIQRNTDGDTNMAADWVTATPTFGAINAGQAALPAKRPAAKKR